MKAISCIFVCFLLAAGAVCAQSLQKCPDLALKDLDGNPVSISQFEGKVVILDFWATWCPPCRQEIPHFVKLHSAYAAKGLAIVGASKEPPAVLKHFAKKEGINYLMCRYEGRLQDEPFKSIKFIPTTFVIDRKGFIVEKFVGYHDISVFEKAIAPLLEAGAEVPTTPEAPAAPPEEGGSMVKISETPIPGGYMRQDVNEPEIRDMAKKATGLLLEKAGQCSLLRIRSAATQVVAGTNYHFVLDLSGRDTIRTWELVMYCGFSGDAEISQSRMLREVRKLAPVSGQAMPGGYMAQNPEEPEIADMAKKAAELVCAANPGFQLLRVHEAATQVVAGLNFYFVLEFQTPAGKSLWQVVIYRNLQGGISLTNSQGIE